MAKGSKGRRRTAFRQFRPTPCSLPARRQGISGDLYHKKCSKPLDKKDWDDVTCSVCMECPHNAVLLLCSSHDKGCRPYMCGTSFRYSNCLDQYKKFYTKVVPSNHEESLHGSIDDPVLAPGVEKCEVTELACPLCRGQVKGWTVVEPAREYLNAKKRSCMQDDCTFVGAFKELRKHMKADHPCARPREVDPTLEQKWRRLEREREREDVISTIRSAMPGAMVFGDYVIEGNHHGFDTDEEDGLDAEPAEMNGSFEVGIDSSNFVNFFLLLHAFGPSGNNDLGRQPRQPTHAADEDAVDIHHTSPAGDASSSGQDDDEDNVGDISLVSRLRQHGRLLLGHSGRRRRRREATDGGISHMVGWESKWWKKGGYEDAGKKTMHRLKSLQMQFEKEKENVVEMEKSVGELEAQAEGLRTGPTERERLEKEKIVLEEDAKKFLAMITWRVAALEKMDVERMKREMQAVEKDIVDAEMARNSWDLDSETGQKLMALAIKSKACVKILNLCLMHFVHCFGFATEVQQSEGEVQMHARQFLTVADTVSKHKDEGLSVGNCFCRFRCVQGYIASTVH
ncbi:hypothetical protein GQ457_03G001210 [Hibiscus cannabinus]